jgi:hypothetical protein
LWDARIDTPLDEAGIVNGFVGNDLDVTGARVIVPQDLAKSIMHKRLSTATELYKMPPMGKNKVDADAVALLEQWIAEVTASPPKPLPTPWKHADIGNVAFVGNAAYGGGAFTVQGSGDDIWGGADGMHFMYQDMTGDGTMIARNLSQTNTDGWAKAGVMIRETLNADSKHAFTAITPGNGSVSQGRDTTGGESFYDGNVNGMQPKWLRIQRKGNNFRRRQHLDRDQSAHHRDDGEGQGRHRHHLAQQRRAQHGGFRQRFLHATRSVCHPTRSAKPARACRQRGSAQGWRCR